MMKEVDPLVVLEVAFSAAMFALEFTEFVEKRRKQKKLKPKRRKRKRKK